MRSPVDRAVGEKVEDETVRLVEHPWDLHAQAREFGDIEEPAIVDVVGRHPEMRRTPVLEPDQRIEARPG